MTLADRLFDLADALQRQSLREEPLQPVDMDAIATALRGEADALQSANRERARKAWLARKAA